MEEQARSIVRELRRMGDPARAKGVQNYFRHAVVALGIDTKTLRDYARRQTKQFGPDTSLVDAVALCDRLLREPEMEIRGVGMLILGAFSKQFTPKLLPHAGKWLKTRLDNWALVDGFCTTVLSPLLSAHPSVVDTLKRWSGRKTLWVRRAALVTLVPFARRGQRLDLAYQLARDHLVDSEDLMHKATGWLLREAGKTDMPRLKAFLVQHGPQIPRTALRYAIERFPARERTRLLAITRSESGR